MLHSLKSPIAYPSVGDGNTLRSQQPKVRLRIWRTISGEASSRSKRQPKDPKQFKDYDEIRARLHEERAGFVSGLINTFSSSAFGKSVSDDSAGPLTVVGRLYRRVLDSQWASSLQSGVEQRPGYTAHSGSAPEAEPQQIPSTDAAATPFASGLRGVQVVFNCSDAAALAMARRYPPLLSVSASQLHSRLVALKAALPLCNVAEIVQQHPQHFLEPPEADVVSRASEVHALLRELLHGADVDAMVSEDPLLLTQDPALLVQGIRELHSLWDVDSKALASSDPWKLALAVRALSPVGPPSKF